MASITREQALDIALERVATMRREPELVIQEEKTIEREFGWVFFVTTKQYLVTGNPGYLIPGIGPLIVDKESGKTEFLPTSVPPERAIEEYEQRWRHLRSDAS